MNSRLIPWCLAATAFVVTLTVSAWQGKLGGPGQLAQPHAATEQRSTPPATDHQGFWSSQASAATPAAPERAPGTLTLPLPPATQPELDPDVQPVPDDEPTVDDLPGRRDSSLSPDDE
jgi:hypothetical protein